MDLFATVVEIQAQHEDRICDFCILVFQFPRLLHLSSVIFKAP